MPSCWSIRPDGTYRRASSCHTTSALSPCRQNPPSSTRSKTSGSLCVTTGSRTASSNPTTILSTTAARLGTSSSTNQGASCPSDCANGPTGSDQWDLVLAFRTGGEGGIRTPDTLASMPHFECGAFNRSATSPTVETSPLFKDASGTFRERVQALDQLWTKPPALGGASTGSCARSTRASPRHSPRQPPHRSWRGCKCQ